MMQKTWKMSETLANGYLYESTRRELSNEYEHDRVSMVFESICILVLWMNVVSALEGLTPYSLLKLHETSQQYRHYTYPLGLKTGEKGITLHFACYISCINWDLAIFLGIILNGKLGAMSHHKVKSGVMPRQPKGIGCELSRYWEDRRD